MREALAAVRPVLESLGVTTDVNQFAPCRADAAAAIGTYLPCRHVVTLHRSTRHEGGHIQVATCCYLPSMDRLDDALTAHAHAVQQVDATRTELHAAIRCALRDGARQADLARRTGYTREHLRRIARENSTPPTILTGPASPPGDDHTGLTTPPEHRSPDHEHQESR